MAPSASGEAAPDSAASGRRYDELEGAPLAPLTQ
jgi:hypothetical protein